MSLRTLFLTIFGTMMLSTLVVPTDAQITEQAAREQTRNAVRSQLHLKPDQFLGVQRDEKLEQLLAIAVGRPDGLQFIYQVSQAGDEVKENAIVRHIFTDVDPKYIVAVSLADGTTYRIHGFSDSLAEFERLIIGNKDQGVEPRPGRSRLRLLSESESPAHIADHNYELDRAKASRRASVSDDLVRS
jgi:hypothetical protein